MSEEGATLCESVCNPFHLIGWGRPPRNQTNLSKIPYNAFFHSKAYWSLILIILDNNRFACFSE